MDDMAFIISRMLEHKIAIAENNDQNTLIVTLDVLKEILVLLKEQEEKTGKWIPVTNGRGGMECSICHDYAPSYQNGTEYLSTYCPNCGAKMEGR